MSCTCQVVVKDTYFTLSKSGSCGLHCHKFRHDQNHLLSDQHVIALYDAGSYVFARVCLFVCVSARELKKLWKDFSEIFRECREWQKLQVIQFWG